MAKTEKRTCVIDNCDKPMFGSGLCSMHYQRKRRHGDEHFSMLNREHNDTCSVIGCNRPYEARGLCQMHYQRLMRTGKTKGTLVPKTLHGLLHNSGEDPETGCLNWKMPHNGKRIKLPRIHFRGKVEFVYRVVWHLATGKSLSGVHIKRVCGNPLCINPDHMQARTVRRKE